MKDEDLKLYNLQLSTRSRLILIRRPYTPRTIQFLASFFFQLIDHRAGVARYCKADARGTCRDSKYCISVVARTATITEEPAAAVLYTVYCIYGVCLLPRDYVYGRD
jgi:hypothetical protein